jgi:hypothetical protein
VSLQDEVIAKHLDVYERTGDGNIPYVLNKTVAVTDGFLAISFGRSNKVPRSMQYRFIL